MKDEITDCSIVEHLPDGSLRLWTEEQFRQVCGCSYEEYRGEQDEQSSQVWISLQQLLGKGFWLSVRVTLAVKIGVIG